MYSDVMSDAIFSSFVFSAKIDADLDKVVADCYELMESDEGIHASNGPQTYHSTRVEGDEGLPDNELGKALRGCLQFTKNFIEDQSLEMDPYYCWWLNASKFGGYNSPHMHGKTDLVGIFYPRIPSDVTSDLVLTRNDGFSYSPLILKTGGLNFNISPEPGRFYLISGHLWHHVEASLSKEDRLSISMNLYVRGR